MITNNKDNTIRIVRGEDRYAGATNVDQSLRVNLQGPKKNYIEGNRSILINLEERFDIERQKSNIFRISGKITNIFNNIISGQTSYEPFRNNLYYTNALQAVQEGSPWQGYPQYNEFSFYRTQGIDGHIPYVSKSASSYNWMTYVTYPSENLTGKDLKIKFETTDGTLTYNFNLNDGVPYYIKNKKVNGKNLITFYCGFKHNLEVGDWIYLKNSINGKRLFKVYSLGDESYGNEDKVFSIFNLGYNNPLFGDNSKGSFKRVLNNKNVDETMSSYYIKKHKILTKISNSDITKMGFERNPFPIEQQLEYSGLTPNGIQRISIKDGSQTVGFSFDEDIDITNLKDNLDRPLTELYVTIINRGYMGWFNNPSNPGNNTGLQVGWEYNFLENEVDDWWSINNIKNRDTIPVGSYNFNGLDFYYNKSLNVGDTIMGDICEFNQYLQIEKTLSNIYHKFSYNPQIFDNNSPNSLPDGYTYNPHYPISIRVFSDYVEVGDRGNVDGIPDYSFFSKSDNQWRWRDLYPYGTIDSDGNGVDLPFINGAHYAFKDIIFLQTPIMRNINVNNDIIFAPLQDDCE